MKKNVRKEYLAKRKQFTTTEINAWSLKIADIFLNSEFIQHQTFHVFLSMPKFNEVNTQYIIDELLRQAKDVVVPKMDGKQLLSCPYTNETKLVENSWGIMEPESNQEVSPDKIDVVIVPMLISDAKGNRIGYGGGFYDRFLSSLDENTKFVGVNFFESVKEDIPREEFDVLLDYLITPNDIYKFEK